jgi:hypothetical protein
MLEVTLFEGWIVYFCLWLMLYVIYINNVWSVMTSYLFLSKIVVTVVLEVQHR